MVTKGTNRFGIKPNQVQEFVGIKSRQVPGLDCYGCEFSQHCAAFHRAISKAGEPKSVIAKPHELSDFVANVPRRTKTRTHFLEHFSYFPPTDTLETIRIVYDLRRDVYNCPSYSSKNTDGLVNYLEQSSMISHRATAIYREPVVVMGYSPEIAMILPVKSLYVFNNGHNYLEFSHFVFEGATFRAFIKHVNVLLAVNKLNVVAVQPTFVTNTRRIANLDKAVVHANKWFNGPGGLFDLMERFGQAPVVRPLSECVLAGSNQQMITYISM
jgi:hypothetical protein